ncbi:MAG: hypothetical protein EXR70_07375 [Deltaproteobacteria bacterium]|nr:hypothetical protein [Deltaproteobacteria bacterium]
MPATMRYGAAEIFGRAIQQMTTSALRQAASADHKTIGCPYKSKGTSCHKKWGVCSLVEFEREVGGAVNISAKPVTTCPTRFYEAGIVHSWVGETLIGTKSPVVVNEVSFLMADSGSKESSTENEVGRIDSVLVNTASQRLEWCALEMQAVYFSGKSMENDFRIMRNWSGPGLPFPAVHRRPDFRSSGPKRLMPQLQIKVPTLRRWGKKMAVVVDEAFWNSLGSMRKVQHLSSADIGA